MKWPSEIFDQQAKAIGRLLHHRHKRLPPRRLLVGGAMSTRRRCSESGSREMCGGMSTYEWKRRWLRPPAGETGRGQCSSGVVAHVQQWCDLGCAQLRRRAHGLRKEPSKRSRRVRRHRPRFGVRCLPGQLVHDLDDARHLTNQAVDHSSIPPVSVIPGLGRQGRTILSVRHQ
jgi:hypothetical protein